MLRLSFSASRDTNGDGLLDARGGDGRPVQLIGDRTQHCVDLFERLLAYAVVAGKRVGVEQFSAGWSDVYVYEKRFLQ